MNTENRQNYYEILELTENATQQEIHAAYAKARETYSADNKAMSSIFSPVEAAELRTLIEEAFEVLSNNTYRNIYEKRLLANTFDESDLTAEAIKIASVDLFQRATPPQVKPETAMATPTTVINKMINVSLEEEWATKKDWTGEDIKKVREHRNLSFDELTDITKINPWYIAALEEMDAANLPVEVFVRGYILQVAKALGLKERVVTDSYMRLFRKMIEN